MVPLLLELTSSHVFFFLCLSVYLPTYINHSLVHFHALYISFHCCCRSKIIKVLDLSKLNLLKFDQIYGNYTLSCRSIFFRVLISICTYLYKPFIGSFPCTILQLHPITWLCHHFLLQHVLIIPSPGSNFLEWQHSSKTAAINTSNSLPYTYCTHVWILAILSPYTVILISHCVSGDDTSLSATSICN